MKTEYNPLENIKQALQKAETGLEGGPAIYTVLRSVSKSGMSRVIAPIVIVDDKPLDLTVWACDFWGKKVANTPNGAGVRVTGCGMDMGFHLAYEIASACGRVQHNPHRQGFTHRWL